MRHTVMLSPLYNNQSPYLQIYLKHIQRSKIWIKNSFYETHGNWYILVDPVQFVKGAYKPGHDSLFKNNQEWILFNSYEP